MHMARFVAASGVCVMALLFPLFSHRDGDGGSTSSSSALEAEASESVRSEFEQQGLMLDSECKTGIDSYQADDAGIDALKECVRALELYASKVRDHEKESYKAHGRYRRAFIQTYALLKSVLDQDKHLHKFRETFARNHTEAAKYLTQQLEKIKPITEQIGQKWGDNGADDAEQVPSLTMLASGSTAAASGSTAAASATKDEAASTSVDEGATSSDASGSDKNSETHSSDDSSVGSSTSQSSEGSSVGSSTQAGNDAESDSSASHSNSDSDTQDSKSGSDDVSDASKASSSLVEAMVDGHLKRHVKKHHPHA